MSCMGCFSSPQIPLLPTTPTTSAPKRTSVSRSPSENPSAPSPHITTTCRSGCASAVASAYPEPVPRQPYGPGYALATALAHPDRQVVVMWGDGALGFSLGDLDTLVRFGADVVGVVGNNGIWGLEKHPMQLIYGYDVAAELRPGTRYDEVMTALGGHGEFVREPDEIGPALYRAFATPGPSLVNILTDPDDAYPRS